MRRSLKVNSSLASEEKRVPRGVWRIIDANFNRAKEGLRVCEEVCRFILNERALTEEFKQIRHALDAAVKKLHEKNLLLTHRYALRDVGREISRFELKRKGYKDVYLANLQRVKESLRVLEEFSKITAVSSALKFKSLRYSLYELEKKALRKILK